jgi:hypothetical protein
VEEEEIKRWKEACLLTRSWASSIDI